MATRSIDFHGSGPSTESVARPPSSSDRVIDRAVHWITLGFAWSIIVLGAYIVLQVGWAARAALGRFGFSLLHTTTWDQSRELFGLVPSIWGTLYSSLIGLAIGRTFFGLSIAIVLSQGLSARGRRD